MRYAVLPRLWANWITLRGSIVTTISGFGIILLLVIGLSAPKGNPYLGLFVIIVLPVTFGLGLLIIGTGLQVERRRRREGPPDPLQAAFAAAFEDPSARKRILFVAIGTVSTVALFALAGHKALSYLGSS